MNSVVTTLAPSFLIGSSSFLQATRIPIKSRKGSKLGSIPQRVYEFAALERLEKSLLTYNGRNLVATLVPSFSNGSASFLQVTRSFMKAWMNLNFDKIPSLTSELAALERVKNQ